MLTYIFLAWEKNPLAPPKVGDKFILWGSLERADPKAKEPPRFWVSSFHRYPFSEEKRKWAIEDMRRCELDRKKYQQEEEARLEREKQAATAWRKSFTQEQLIALTGQASKIVVGKIVSGPQAEGEMWLYDFKVVEWMKNSGLTDGTNRPKHIRTWVSQAAGEQLSPRKDDWVLFLPSKPEISAPFFEFRALRDGAALVQAESAVLTLIRNTVTK